MEKTEGPNETIIVEAVKAMEEDWKFDISPVNQSGIKLLKKMKSKIAHNFFETKYLALNNAIEEVLKMI